MNDSQERVDAFKVGFLGGLADRGLLPSEFFRMAKQAAGGTDLSDPAAVLSSIAGGISAPMGTVAGKAMDIGASAAGTAGKALLAAPIVTGGLAGIVAERLNSPDPKAIENLQKAELIGLYRRLAVKMKERRSRRELGERVV
jgi:hypothetical protein